VSGQLPAGGPGHGASHRYRHRPRAGAGARPCRAASMAPRWPAGVLRARRRCHPPARGGTARRAGRDRQDLDRAGGGPVSGRPGGVPGSRVPDEPMASGGGAGRRTAGDPDARGLEPQGATAAGWPRHRGRVAPVPGSDHAAISASRPGSGRPTGTSADRHSRRKPAGGCRLPTGPGPAGRCPGPAGYPVPRGRVRGRRGSGGDRSGHHPLRLSVRSAPAPGAQHGAPAGRAAGYVEDAAPARSPPAEHRPGNTQPGARRPDHGAGLEPGGIPGSADSLSPPAAASARCGRERPSPGEACAPAGLAPGPGPAGLVATACLGGQRIGPCPRGPGADRWSDHAGAGGRGGGGHQSVPAPGRALRWPPITSGAA
jgi:hypothetical protein